MKPDVMPLFDEVTNTVSYVVADPATRAAALVDSVLDFDPKSGRTATTSADRMIALVRERGLTVEWILETHVHADHLSAAPYLKDRVGGRIGIGEHIREVQKVFRTLFNMEPGFVADGRQFDHLFADGERFRIGQLEAQAIHTPGHTPADMTYVVGDAAFVGDTLFQPDYGTARCDFPGGDAHALYHSIRRILSLPPETRIFTGHDYKAPGRDEYSWESTVAEQRARNVHVRNGVSETEFVELRTARDRTLDMPKLILPSVQVNVRAGRLPPAEENGKRYLKIPIDTL
ncbi:MAG: MBL fold metallo-hydrolase [Alphaproteobacteria bacterium]